MNINDVVARKALKLMEENNISQYKLEKLTNITHGAMDRILSGKNKTVTLTTVYKFAKAFQMTILDFLNDEYFLSDKIELD